MSSDYPLQPIYRDENGIHRFRENAIVRFLLDGGSYDMGKLGAMTFSDEDREQFAMLIGYSISGLSELSYVSDRTLKRVEKAEAAFVKKRRPKKGGRRQ